MSEVIALTPPMLLATAAAIAVAMWLVARLLRPGTRGPGGAKLPPGPPGYPIIGNLSQLGSLPHQNLRKLAQRYGPVMSLRLGSVPAIVVSSPHGAEMFLKTHDLVFASRPQTEATKHMAYGSKGLANTPYGSYWRHIRKLCTLELFTNVKIDSFAPMRKEEIGLLVDSLKKSSADGEVVNVSDKINGLIEDITYRMVIGRTKYENFDLKSVVEETLRLAGTFNIADFVPLLKPFDPQRMIPKMKKLGKLIDGILEKIIDEHEEAAQNSKESGSKPHRDFVDTLLSLKNKTLNPNDKDPHRIERTNIKAVLFDVAAGTIDTSGAGILWTLSELLRHPRTLKKLQAEIESLIGKDRTVEETDLNKLVYLDMVVKESLRLHPVAPLLLPHESREDIVIDGYFIPKKSRIIVNAHAIGRDPAFWSENSEEFYPERFEGSSLDIKGHDFQLIPFGSGRRGCAGMHLGLTTVKIVVSQLVHCFDWELPGNMAPGELDMTDKFGLSLYRATPLKAVPTYRLQI
uniref:Cytochrome P450 n=1 Tax=Kalanchoe fedtschenkoi TaxID=63787 RepID=A0A7N0UTL3_KALFE